MKSLNKKQRLERVAEEAKRDKHVAAVLLFGSHAGKRASKNSDIDICLLFSDRNTASGRELEFSSISDAVDVSDFYSLPIYIRKRILKDGKVLFCRNERLLYDASLKTIKEYRHYGRHYNYYLRRIANG